VPLKILLADDSMTAQNMGKKILSEAGYEIVAVSNGAAALKKIAEIRPDIAILDVFMPGYTGPEVCERIKNVHETSKIPVLLTVGKMEMTAFKPEETNRVKADGLIIKPFEATDLLSVIQKMEKKVAAPAKPLPTAFESDDETPIYEKTVKLDVREFRDASYDEWKTTAEEHTDEEQPTKKPAASVPSDMAGAPAFMMDEAAAPVEEQRSTQVLEKGQTIALEAPANPGYSSTVQLPPQNPAGTVPDWAISAPEPVAEVAPALEVPPVAEIPAAEPATGVRGLLSKAKTWFGGAATGEAAAALPQPEDMQAAPPLEVAPVIEPPAPDFSAPMAMAAELPPPEIPLEPVAVAPVAEIEAVTPHPLEVEQAAHRDTVQISHATDSALDTSMHRETHADVPVEMNPDLDTSMHRDASEPHIGGMDPALVTDASEMASAFPTKFGMEGASIDPVGVAAEVPGLYDSDHAEGAVAPAEIAAPPAEVGIAPEIAAAPAEIAVAPGEALTVEEPTSGWRAEEHHLEDHEHGIRLEHEMQQHYASQAAVAEPEPATTPEPAAAPAPAVSAQTNAPDMQFAAAMAAAVGAEMPAAASADNTAAMDPEMIARVVQRVTERMRPDLIAEITKELMKEREKK